MSIEMHWQSTNHEYRPGAEDSYVRLTLSEGHGEDRHAHIKLTADQVHGLIRALQHEAGLIEEHEAQKIQAGSRPYSQIWVCVSCMLDRECEPGASERTDALRSWSTAVVHNYDVTADFALTNDTMDPGHEDFSTRPCEACHSSLGGERFRYAIWVPARPRCEHQH